MGYFRFAIFILPLFLIVVPDSFAADDEEDPLKKVIESRQMFDFTKRSNRIRKENRKAKLVWYQRGSTYGRVFGKDGPGGND